MRIFLAVAIITISACTTIKETRGAELRETKTSQISADSTKADIVSLLGSPSTTSTYGNDVWYYINTHKNRSLYGSDNITKQEVLAITFDENDVVQYVEVFDKNSAREFAISRERTPTAGHELGVIEQILGNVGRFNTDGESRQGF